MQKEYLDSRVKNAIINIDKNVSDIKSAIGDLSMKLCYIIKYKHNNDYNSADGVNYAK